MSGVKAERFGFTSLHRRVWSELEEHEELDNPSKDQTKDKHGTLTASIEKCRELGYITDDRVFQVALGSTGALEGRRKKIPKGTKKRLHALPRRAGRPNKKGKKDTDHLRNDPKYAALIAAMDS